MRIPLDHLHAPDWVRTAIFYQISPDLFWRGNESWDVNPCAPADSRPCCGNCAGIREVIPYLENLGITALYLTPIFHADSYHKYDTLNYFAIDPSFGGNDQFRVLVDALHQRGIRIVLDGWRLDTTEYCPPGFVEEIRKGSKGENPDTRTYWGGDWAGHLVVQARRDRRDDALPVMGGARLLLCSSRCSTSVR